MNAIRPHIAITYQPKVLYEPIMRDMPPATKDPSAVQPTITDQLAWAICATVRPERDDDGERPCRVPCAVCRAGAAAVLRVAVEQVLPVSTEPNRTINVQPEQDAAFIGAWHIWNTQSKMRSQLLAKAAELETPDA